MYKISIAFLVLFVFSSCELTSEIKNVTADNSSYIVMYGFLSYERGVNVWVAKTLPVTDHDAEDTIAAPNVWLCENDLQVKQFIKETSHVFTLPADSFVFDTTALYSITVEADGFETATSDQQQFVSKTEIDTAYLSADSSRVFYEFYDDPSVENFYAREVLTLDEGESAVFDLSDGFPCLVADDDDYTGIVKKSYALSDSSFDAVLVRLISVSGNYVDFLNSYPDYEMYYEDYCTETVYTVENEVENGIGFLASYEVSEYLVQ